jgi:hypothetical protein
MPTLKRKSFYVDERTLRKARKALRAPTDADAVRRALEWAAQMETFWDFMDRTRGRIRRGSFEAP